MYYLSIRKRLHDNLVHVVGVYLRTFLLSLVEVSTRILNANFLHFKIIPRHKKVKSTVSCIFDYTKEHINFVTHENYDRYTYESIHEQY